MDEKLQSMVDEWLRMHAPDHQGHHVQVGGGAVLCMTCGMVDLTEREMAVAV